MLGEAGTVIRAAGCGPFTAVARAGFALSDSSFFHLFRKQRSHQTQRLHFLLQTGQLHLFLPQDFVHVFHIEGTCAKGRLSQPFLAL